MSIPPTALWQSTGTDATFSDPSDCDRRATKFERQIARRNLIEYAAGAIVILLFGSLAIGALVAGEWLIASAGFLTIAGTALVVWSLHRRASNLDRRPEDACIVHLRRQYHHQYEALSAVPRWYVGPLLPGMALFYFAVGKRVADSIGWTEALRSMLSPAAITLGILVTVVLANHIAARILKRRIEDFDNLA